MTPKSRWRFLIGTAVVLSLVLAYEGLFRFVTGRCGEVDMDSNPPSVYYSYDLMWHLPILRTCFGFRARLPLGKVRLAKGTGVYVEGRRFYYRLADGRLQDVTDRLGKQTALKK